MTLRSILAAGAVGAVALAIAPPAMSAGDPILPLSDVRAGMVGEARTVLTGSTIERFPVRVLDVLDLSDDPGGTLILARAEGSLIAPTGIAEGMSGSPVYVTGSDGTPRVIGAIAFGTGDDDELIVGITPIEKMISAARIQGTPITARHASHPSGRASRPLVLVEGRRAAVRVESRHRGVRALYPLRRWMVAGASPATFGPLARRLRAQGIRATAVPRAISRPEAPLVPGASMTALLSAGDLAVGAIGTVTYVDGRTVLGWGHPFLGAGRSRFLLAGGHVLQTIPAPLSGVSYKLATPTALRGMIVGDRTDGLVARIGGVAGVTVVSRAVDRDRGTDVTSRSIVAPDRRFIPLLATIIQAQPALAVRDGISGGTLRLRITLRSRSLSRPLTYSNAYAAAGDVISLASVELPRLTTILAQNGVRAIPLSSISVTQTLEDEVRAARIQSARIVPRRVRAGQRAVLELTLARWRGAVRRVRRPITIPAHLPPGPVALRVVPNGRGGFDPAPAALDGELDDAATPARTRRALRRVERRARAVSGSRTARLLRAIAQTEPRRNDAVRLLAPGESADGPGAGVPVGDVISGGRAVVRIRVR